MEGKHDTDKHIQHWIGYGFVSLASLQLAQIKYF